MTKRKKKLEIKLTTRFEREEIPKVAKLFPLNLIRSEFIEGNTIREGKFWEEFHRA